MDNIEKLNIEIQVLTDLYLEAQKDSSLDFKAWCKIYIEARIEIKNKLLNDDKKQTDNLQL